MNTEAAVKRRLRRINPDPTLNLGLPGDGDHDPLDPNPEIPTPLDMVTRLTRSDRERRVERLCEMAWDSYEEALAVHGAGKNIAGTCLLYSGGNDSSTIAHLFRPVTTHLVHANTGTGIEATRQFVRDTAKAWNIPLIERETLPGRGYRNLVLGTVYAPTRKTGEVEQSWPGGFPGPAAHHTMYTRLKERGLEKIPHEFGISRSRNDRVVFIAGRRRSESKRRATVPHHEVKGTVIWSSPIALWHKADLRTYRLMHDDVPVNPVARTLGMSGECGCLSNAAPGEREQWFNAYPNEPFLEEIREMERILRDPTLLRAEGIRAGVPDLDDYMARMLAVPEHRKTWGWGADYDDGEPRSEGGMLCGPDCGADPLVDLMDPLFDLEGVA